MSPETSYLFYAFEKYEDVLQEELEYLGADIEYRNGAVFISRGLARRPVWSQTHAPLEGRFKFDSISQAQKILKAYPGLWKSLSPEWHRRSALIQNSRAKDVTYDYEKSVAMKPLRFWTLLSPNEIALTQAEPQLHTFGHVHFNESKIPPSRAYLKLWEAFTFHMRGPRASETVVELGSAPGGWTWVLAQQARRVVSLDRAPLAPHVAKLANVEHDQGDGFKFELPKGEADWLVSDMICEPGKLFDVVRRWQDRGTHKFLCTLKFKGATDFKAVDKFLSVPGSRVVHLHANKHEVTWMLGE